MATQKWAAGSLQGLTWGSAFASGDVNQASFVAVDSVMSSLVLANGGTNLDVFADISVVLASITTTLTAPAISGLAMFIYPLNEDGSTYGDGQFAATTLSTKTPGAAYWVGNVIFPVGTQACVGTLRGIILPPGSFAFVLQNLTGATLASSGNTINYRTYNLQVS